MCTRSNIPSQVYNTLIELIDGDANNLDVTVHNPNKKGDGFLGQMLFVTVKDKKTQQKLDVMVKQAFREHSLRNTLPVRNVFVNEIYFYTKVWPQLNTFQQQIPRLYQFQKVPKCLASVLTENSEYLVLENLKFQHFDTYPKTVPLDKTHFELVLKEYGKFHGVSFAYKALHPEEYADLVKEMIDIYAEVAREGFFVGGMNHTNKTSVEALQPGIDDAIIEKFQPYLENAEELFIETLQNKTKYTTITHGDCWSNNMMFKYNDSGKLTDVRFFDYQLVKGASPCCDLSYCIYSGASKEVLQDLDYYLKVYHDSLSEILAEFGCDVEKIYPMQELKRDWKKFCKLGVIMSLMVWKTKFTFDKELKDYTDVDNQDHTQIFKAGYNKDAFRTIIRDLFYHLYENDFL